MNSHELKLTMNRIINDRLNEGLRSKPSNGKPSFPRPPFIAMQQYETEKKHCPFKIERE